MTGHAFIQHFIQKEEPLVQRVIRHYAIFSSLYIKSSQVELCHSATCGDIQWNEMSCLTGPRCYINTDIQQ